jgi:hypothetical protein
VTSQLFAFRLAQPMEISEQEASAGVYDPVTQTSTWEGGSPVLALRCTSGTTRCYAYGSYCSTSAGTVNRRCEA